MKKEINTLDDYLFYLSCKREKLLIEAKKEFFINKKFILFDKEKLLSEIIEDLKEFTNDRRM